MYVFCEIHRVCTVWTASIFSILSYWRAAAGARVLLSFSRDVFSHVNQCDMIINLTWVIWFVICLASKIGNKRETWRCTARFIKLDLVVYLQKNFDVRTSNWQYKRKRRLFVSPHRYREHTPERSPAAQAVVRSVLTKFMTVVV